MVNPDPSNTDHGASLHFAGVADSIRSTVLGVWSDFIHHVPFLVGGVVVLLLTWLAARLAVRIGYRALSRSRTRESLKDLIIRLAVIAVWTAGLLLTAMVIFPGVTPTKALGALGLVSIAVGFAFKDIFENFFAGILLLWNFPFEKGDYLECEGVMGEVISIDIRMTQIRKPTGELVVLPNSFLFKNPVDILTDRKYRRVSIMAGIAYGEDVEQAVAVITEAVSGCHSILDDRPIQVFPQGFGSSSIDIEVTWWTGSKPVDLRRSRGEVVTAIKRALDNAGIEIPFPYRTLTFKEPLQTRMIDSAD